MPNQKATEWEETSPDKIIGLKRCPKCHSYKEVVLLRRTVSEGDYGDTHREYKVVCQNCGKSTSVHYSKSLTQFEWDSLGKDI